jgi:serine/threonine protein phosphatase PrpC
MATSHPVVPYGVHTSIGRRRNMEDRYIIEELSPFIELYAVLDGHGGVKAVEYFRNIIVKKFQEKLDCTLVSADIEDTIKKIFLEIDTDWFENNIKDGWNAELSGTTFSGVMIMKNLLITINLGDSRIVISKDGKVIFETSDHKASDPKERGVALSKGGLQILGPKYIANNHGNGIAVTRSLGDIPFKFKRDKYIYSGEDSIVSPIPDVTFRHIDGPVSIVICSDGIFDVLSSENAAQFTLNIESTGAFEIAKKLVTKSETSPDNKAAIVVHVP